MKLLHLWPTAILAVATHAWSWSPVKRSTSPAAASLSITYPDNTPPENVDVWCGKAYRSSDGLYPLHALKIPY
jgi:hypothetical protein